MEPMIHLLLIVIVVTTGMKALADVEIRRLERLVRTRQLVVTITADTSQFEAAVSRAATATRRLGGTA